MLTIYRKIHRLVNCRIARGYMQWLIIGFFVLVPLCSCQSITDLPPSAESGLRVIPLDPLTMIDPLTGHSVQGIGEDGGTAWMDYNPVWDKSTVKLRGALSETVAFQLVFLLDPAVPLQDIRIECSLSPIKQVRVSRAWCIWNIPEIAVPVGDGWPAFNLPSDVPLEKEQFARETYRAWSVFVEGEITSDTAPGQYSGTVTVKASAGEHRLRLPVEMTIYPFSLPVQPSLIIEMNSYGDYGRYLEADAENYLALQRFMRRFRCTFTQVPYFHSGRLGRSFFAPRVTWDDQDMPVLDWTDFDRVLGGLFDGTAFADGIPVSHFILPFNYQWPLPFTIWKDDPERYRRGNIAVRKLFRAHAEQKGWNGTIFQEFHNENPDVGARCPWYLDEPRTPDDLEGHNLYLDLFHAAFKPVREGGRFHYRIDVSQWQKLGPSLGRAAPRINDWIVSRDRQFLYADSAPMFREWADRAGGLLFEYGEMTGFAHGGRAVNWSEFNTYIRNCRIFDLDGFEQWKIDKWETKRVSGPGGVLCHSRAGGLRDWIWPGNHFGRAEPLASFRLLALREGLNLADYARLAEECSPAHRAEIDALIRGMDTATSADHYRIKRQLADMLLQPASEESGQ